MSVKVVHERDVSEEMMRVQELCCLCRTPTRFWYGTGALNVALCQDCAKSASKNDIPTKDEWFAKELSLRKCDAYY